MLLTPGLTGCILVHPVVLEGSQALPTATSTSAATPTLRPIMMLTGTAHMPSPYPTEIDDVPLVAITSAPEASPTSLSLDKRRKLFAEVWGIIDEHYLYDGFGGVDWNDVGYDYAPRVVAVETDAEFYSLLSEMVGQLGDQHSRFLAPSAAADEDALSTGHEATVGVGVVTMPTTRGALIQQVFANSPAAEADLRIRDRIVAIDGVPTNVGSTIQGPEGSQVRLSVLRPGQPLRDVVLVRRPVEGRISPVTRRLEGDIGYLSVSTLWVNDMDDQVSGALTDLVIEKPLRGLIIDMRSNPGGWRDVLTGILSHFVRGKVGAFFDQQSETPLVIQEGSGPDLRNLPLVVLVDQNTASYAELMTAILRAEADAYVIGLPLSGNTETIYAYELTGGARLWVAQEGFRLRNGVDLEGRGLQPDMPMNVDWTHFSEQEDPYIREALRYFRQ